MMRALGCSNDLLSRPHPRPLLPKEAELSSRTSIAAYSCTHG